MGKENHAFEVLVGVGADGHGMTMGVHGPPANSRGTAIEHFYRSLVLEQAAIANSLGVAMRVAMRIARRGKYGGGSIPAHGLAEPPTRTGTAVRSSTGGLSRVLVVISIPPNRR